LQSEQFGGGLPAVAGHLDDTCQERVAFIARLKESRRQIWSPNTNDREARRFAAPTDVNGDRPEPHRPDSFVVVPAEQDDHARQLVAIGRPSDECSAVVLLEDLRATLLGCAGRADRADS
jgi:hypothetical protein